MSNMHVKTGDKVVVLAGKDKGKTGAVIDSFPKEKRVSVKGVNIVVKHRKPRSAQDKGGITKLEGKIDASNVQVICPSCNKATRIANKVNEKGQKTRVCQKCGANLDVNKVAKKSKAKATKVQEVAKAPAKTAEKTAATKATETKTAAKKPATKATAPKSVAPKATATKTVAPKTVAAKTNTAKKSSPTRKTAGK